MGELGSGRMGRRIHLPGVLVFLWPQQTDSTALNTSQLSWQNPESKSMSCSFHPGLPGFHQCKSKTSHWLLCWTKWVHFYIVSAQQSCLTWSEEHCQDADVNREKNLLNLPLLCSGGSSTQTTWMVWLQLNSSFFKISWFPKHLFFFFPALRTCSFTAAKWSFTSCVGEQNAFPWISHARGFNPCCISFSGHTIITHHNLLVPGFLKWNTTKYHQLLSNWEKIPCLRWKNHLLSGRRQQNNVLC